MNIAFLDGYTINPGDLTWDSLEALGKLTVYDRTDADEVIDRARDAEVIIVNKTPLTAAHFEALPQLKLVCVAATGYDRIDIQAASAHGVTVCNCAGYSSRAVAQMAVSLLLEVADSVGTYAELNRQGEWARRSDFCYTLHPRLELVGKRAAIVGFGNIGQAIADILRALGMKLYAVSSKSQEELPADVTKLSLAEAFATCDVVSLNCPLNEANRGFVNAELLAQSNPHLILINTARGALINEADVAQALQAGKLGAYCTDVLQQEPSQADCPLFQAPRAWVTPHIGWNTPEARQRILAILKDNIEGFLNGTPKSVVN